MEYPKSYIQFLAHFHGDRDYFECHEILEEYWKTTDAKNKNSIWVALILLAVSSYHYRRHNIQGAFRTLKKSVQILEANETISRQLGLDHEALMKILKKRENNLHNGTPYMSFNLPIIDTALIELCQEECKVKGFHWGAPSNLENSKLIHRHSMRDRSDVISERSMALKNKSRKRKGSE